MCDVLVLPGLEIRLKILGSSSQEMLAQQEMYNAAQEAFAVGEGNAAQLAALE
jgi:sarcosine oxidase gamma subunit